MYIHNSFNIGNELFINNSWKVQGNKVTPIIADFMANLLSFDEKEIVDFEINQH